MERNEIIRGFIEMGDPEFLFSVDYLKDADINLKQEPEKARNFLEEQSALGNVEAQFVLSKLLLLGLVGDINQREAFIYCKKAFDAGYQPAQEMLSHFYLGGWYVDQDIDYGIQLLKRAVDAGSGHAAFLLSTAYENGINVDPDIEKGKQLLEIAANLGDAVAQYFLGISILETEDPSLFAKGVQWLLSSANQNHLTSHRKLARLYSQGGAGLSKNMDKTEFHNRTANDIEASLKSKWFD